MEKIPSRYNWMFQKRDENLIIDDKASLIRKYEFEELTQLLEMFTYKDLPPTLDQRTLELFILRGYALIFFKDGKPYNGFGSFSGVNDYRYIPEEATLTNTYLNYSNTLKVITPLNVDEITKDNLKDYVLVIPNDYLYYGVDDAINGKRK